MKQLIKIFILIAGLHGLAIAQPMRAGVGVIASSGKGGSISLTGLQLYYDISNASSYPGSGTTLTDLSGNSRNATLVNGVGYTATNGGALTFDGTNDYTETSGYSVTGYTNATISIWVKSNNTTTNQTIAAMHGNSTRITGFVIASGAKVDFAYNINSTPALITPATSYSTGTWYNYVITYDSGASQLKGYVNGTNFGTGTISGAWTNPGGTVSTYLGAVSTASGYHNCSIGHYLVYNRTLSAAEVLANFNATKTRFGY